MAKKAAKKRNPQDTTLRNANASKRRSYGTNKKLKDLAKRVDKLESLLLSKG